MPPERPRGIRDIDLPTLRPGKVAMLEVQVVVVVVLFVMVGRHSSNNRRTSRRRCWVARLEDLDSWGPRSEIAAGLQVLGLWLFGNAPRKRKGLMLNIKPLYEVTLQNARP